MRWSFELLLEYERKCLQHCPPLVFRKLQSGSKRSCVRVCCLSNLILQLRGNTVGRTSHETKASRRSQASDCASTNSGCNIGRGSPAALSAQRRTTVRSAILLGSLGTVADSRGYGSSAANHAAHGPSCYPALTLTCCCGEHFGVGARDRTCFRCSGSHPVRHLALSRIRLEALRESLLVAFAVFAYPSIFLFWGAGLRLAFVLTEMRYNENTAIVCLCAVVVGCVLSLIAACFA